MRPFKIGIVGVSRGKFILAMEELLREDIEVVAVCETNPKVVETLREQKVLRDSVAVYDDFDAFLEHGLDAIMLCNYFHEHTPYAIRAMEKGIAVFSETTAAPSLGECVELVEAYEKYGGKYMLGANCLYFRAVQTMKKRMEEGKYGKISYADAEYVHPFVGGDPIPGLGKLDLEDLHWRQTLPKCYYNMHDLGPLMYMTGTLPKRVIGRAVECEPRGNSMVNHEKCFVIAEMDNGAVFQCGGCTSTGSLSKWYRIACQGGTVETVRYDKKEENIVECEAHGEPTTTLLSWSDSGAVTPEEEEKYFSGDAAAKYHGGIDLVLLLRFIRFLKGEEQPFFDVYHAVALSATGILAWYSALLGGKQLEIPDFRSKADRDRVRGDYRKPFAKKYADLTLPCRLGEKFEM